MKIDSILLAQFEVWQLAMSIVAITISLVAISWNVYRDIIQKPSLRVSFSKSTIQNQGGHFGHHLSLQGVNFGPGKLHLNLIVGVQKGHEKCWWKFRFRHQVNMMINAQYDNPFTKKFPWVIEVGETLQLCWNIDDVRDLQEGKGGEVFIESDDIYTIGLSDSFGKTHWVPRQEYEKAVKHYYTYKNTTDHEKSEADFSGA